MSVDVSLAQMSPPTAWRRGLPLWDAYFGVVALASLISAVAAGRPVATGLIVALAAWYAGFGRRLIADDGSTAQGLIYLAGVAALLTPAVMVHVSTSQLLWALSPQAMMMLPIRWGVAVAFLLNMISPVVWLAQRRTWQSLLDILPMSLMGFAVTVVIGVTIVRLIAQSHELYESRAEVARLSREAERQRLAADIHDTVAQGLSSLVMLIQAAEAGLERDRAQTRRHLQLAARTARDNLNEIRAVLDAIAPAQPDLAAALRRLAGRFREETGVACTVEVAGAVRALPTSAEVVLLRAAQESLSNVRRHAGAGSVRVRLRYEEQSVGLTVHDDGRGFEPGKTTSGYGLQGMRQRVEQVGGSFAVDSRAGQTRVRVAVPA